MWTVSFGLIQNFLTPVSPALYNVNRFLFRNETSFQLLSYHKSHSRAIRARALSYVSYGGGTQFACCCCSFVRERVRTCITAKLVELAGLAGLAEGRGRPKEAHTMFSKYRKSLTLQSYRARTRVICSWQSSNLVPRLDLPVHFGKKYGF